METTTAHQLTDTNGDTWILYHDTNDLPGWWLCTEAKYTTPGAPGRCWFLTSEGPDALDHAIVEATASLPSILRATR